MPAAKKITPKTVDADQLYTVNLLRPIRVGRSIIRPAHTPIVLKGRVISENAEHVEPGTIAKHTR